MRARIATLILAAAALGGCGYNGLGMGVGYGSGYGPYAGYGYGGPYGGYGYSPYGYTYGRYGPYSPYYGSPYGGGLGYYGGMPYWGWNDGWYYPGTGYYVYDRDRKRRVWSEAEKAYWSERVQQSSANRGVTKVPNSPSAREIWTDFRRQPGTTTSGVTTTSTQRVMSSRPSRSERIQQREQRRTERQSTRSTNGVTRVRRDD